jgi:signal transduction histidine kinase
MSLIDNHAGTGVLKALKHLPGVDDYLILIGAETTVGRHPGNRLRLPFKTVSRHHALIRREGPAFFVEDLDSSNGSFVNDERVKSRELKNGDVVRFGDCEFVFQQETTSPRAGTTDPNVRLALRDVPLARGEEVLHVQSVEEAGEALVSIDKIESVDQANQFLRAHYRLLEIIRANPGEDRLLESFLELVVPLVRADRGVVMLSEKERDEMRPAAVYYHGGIGEDQEVSISRTILDRCLEERVGILSRDARSDERFLDSESVVAQNVRSAICAPLVAHGLVIGVCYLDRQATSIAFGDSQLAFVTNLCSQLTLALDNLRMVDERRQAEQHALIGRTMAEVSHSIKNILAVTQNGSELLDRQLERGDLSAVKKTWSLVHSGMHRMNQLAKSMLDYSRSDAFQRSEVEVNAIVQSVLDVVRPQMEELGIRVDFIEKADQSLCWVDPDALYDSLMNLAVNSRDALVGRPGPFIEFRTALAEPGRVLISVRDNGSGIPPEILGRVFDPFFTTKGAEGNGMGLAMLRKFCNEMAGSVEALSEPDQGTEFRLTLPLAEESDPSESHP